MSEYPEFSMPDEDLSGPRQDFERQCYELAMRWKDVHTDESYGPQGKNLGILARGFLATKAPRPEESLINQLRALKRSAEHGELYGFADEIDRMLAALSEPKNAAPFDYDMRLSVEHGHICLRTETGWLLWECKLGEVPDIGLDVRHLLTEAEARREPQSSSDRCILCYATPPADRHHCGQFGCPYPHKPDAQGDE